MADDNKVVSMAHKSESSWVWTPRQMLEQLIEAIDSGEINPDQMIVVAFLPDGNGNRTVDRWFSRIDRAEGVALLDLVKQMEINKWLR